MSNKPTIASSAFIDQEVEFGENVVVGPGVAIYGPSRLGSGARIDANATIAAPRADPTEQAMPGEICVIGENVVVGAGAVVLPGVTVNAGAVIEPATLVQRNVPALARVSGNPATILGYLNTPNLAANLLSLDRLPAAVGSIDIGVGGARVHRLPHIKDLRGDLSVGEFDSALPFVPLRYFLVFDVPSESTRGEHAHKICHQFLVCTSGRCSVIVDDGRRRAEILLDKPTIGLHIPPGVWGIQYKYSRDAVLLAFASHHYDAGDYIRDYQTFLSSKS